MTKQTIEQWWEEDAERHNRMAEFARKQGYVVNVGKSTKPPVLDKDGTVVTKLKELIRFLSRR